jgi:N-acetylmuramoyl-L-alanine amidase
LSPSRAAATLARIRRLALLAAFLIAAVAAAPSALAGTAAVGSLELDPGRSQAAGKRFTLAGVHWQGGGEVEFRTRSLSGRWSRWRPAAPEAEDGPDRRSRERELRSGWRVGNPWWVGPSDRIETRTTGRVTRVRAHLVWSPERRLRLREPSATVAPAIVPRAAWGANEAIRRGAARYADAVRFTIVHHTAGTNGYTRAQAPGIVKGIHLYHVQSNGWNDIGYNFLVDRFGTIYEGRFGGVERNVIGAHAMGFNTGAVGIALLGTYGSTQPSQAAQDAIAKLIAWRMDVAHADPTLTTTVTSSGSDRYRSGVPVPLRNVSGHRDTGLTSCPGNALYAKLNPLAVAAGALGLPKLYEPRVEDVEGVIRFRARLSATLQWTVTVKSATGVEVARFQSTGRLVDWSWDSTSLGGGRYTWTIAAGSARPASGPLVVRGSTAALTIEAAATPAGVTPNGDGQNDVATLDYRLSQGASLTVQILSPTLAVVATPLDRVWTPAGPRRITVDPATLPDGRYTVVLTAVTSVGTFVTRSVPLTVSRALGLVTLSAPVISPNGDGRHDALEIRFALAAPTTVRARVLREGRWVATPFTAKPLAPGSHVLSWNGRRGAAPVRDGAYAVVLESIDANGTVGATLDVVSDATAPKVEILDSRKLRVRVSEPSTLFLRINGRWTKREIRKAGVVNVVTDVFAARVQAIAQDAAGNRSATATKKRTQG